MFVPQPLWADMSPVEWLVCAWQGHLMMHPAAWLVPRRITEKAGLWNENLLSNPDDDGEYFCRVVLASNGVKFCWGAKTYYRSGISNSLSGLRSRIAWESIFRTLEINTNRLLEVEDSQRVRYACATRVQRFIYEVYPEMPDLQKKAEMLVQQLGGADVKPFGGPGFQLVSRMLGWQRTKQIQKFVYSYGYSKMALGWRLAMLLQKLSHGSSPGTVQTSESNGYEPKSLS